MTKAVAREAAKAERIAGAITGVRVARETAVMVDEKETAVMAGARVTAVMVGTRARAKTAVMAKVIFLKAIGKAKVIPKVIVAVTAVIGKAKVILKGTVAIGRAATARIGPRAKASVGARARTTRTATRSRTTVARAKGAAKEGKVAKPSMVTTAGLARKLRRRKSHYGAKM